MHADTLARVSKRFLALYTGAIADILDNNGYRHHVLPPCVTPFTSAKRLAGAAFHGPGVAVGRHRA